MTNHPVRESTGSARFGEDEKVVQSHPLLPGARPPRIVEPISGTSTTW
jgi:hypothetical protein